MVLTGLVVCIKRTNEETSVYRVRTWRWISGFLLGDVCGAGKLGLDLDSQRMMAFFGSPGKETHSQWLIGCSRETC